MGASSVTGVGPGSVEGKNQGSKHWTVGVGRLLGPKVMAADAATLAGGAATVVLPKLSGNVSDYIVMVSDASGTAAAVSGTIALNTNDTTLTLAGTGTNAVVWSIIKRGLTT